MLSDRVDWGSLKTKYTYMPSDSTARIRTSSNALAWLDCFINQQDGLPYILWRGHWTLAESLPGFEKFEAIPTKKLFDTSTGEVIDSGVLVGPD